MKSKYNGYCTGHTWKARRIVVEKGLAKENEIAYMADSEISEIINNNYLSYQIGDDFLLIPKDKEEEFNKIAEWIER